MKNFTLKFVLTVVLGWSLAFAAEAQTVKGGVQDAAGQPIIGATVIVDGTTLGATTDVDGKFTLNLNDASKDVLVVSYIGMKTQRVAVNGRTEILVKLEEDATLVDDVVVIGYQTVRRKDLTGSVASVSAKEIVAAPVSNLAQALQGKLPGVHVTAQDGRPDAEISIRVRGGGSISQSNEPLILVDGIPGTMSDIPAEQVQSIDVLKDASSTAIYGARGANGVIMITTKKARAGEAIVTFDGKWGVNTKALQQYDVTEQAGEFYEMHYGALRNYQTMVMGLDAASAHATASNILTSGAAGGLGYNVYDVPAGQTLIGSNGKLNPNAKLGRKVTYNGQEFLMMPDNWLDEIYKTSFRQEYNASVSGATQRANFYASIGYLDNTGIIDGSDMERYTARLRADYNAKKWLKVGGNFSYTHFNWNNGNDPENEGASDGGNAFATAMRMAPIYPLFMRDGEGNIMIDEYGFQMYDTGDGRNGGMFRRTGGQSNDLQDIKLNKNNNEGNAFTANGFADFYIIDGLTATVNASITIDETRSTTLLNPYYGQFATSGGVVSKSHGRSIAFNAQQLLSYKRSFGKHNMDLLLGHEMYNTKSYGLYASRSGMFSPSNDELSGLVTDMSNSGSSISEYNNEGYFFRGQYDYDERIFGSVSYRRDASSRFHPDNRWGNFWSLGAAWIISKESWYDLDWLDMLKLKASYGSQGNDNIGSFRYTDVYSIQNDGQGGVTTVLASKGNKDITWETNSNLNFGVEFSALQGRIYGGIDVFRRQTSDMLFSLSVPVEAGYSSIYTNIGDMRNAGLEIDLGADIFRTKDFLWSVNINMTHYKNKVISLPDQYKTQPTADGNWMGRINGNRFLAEGMSYYEYYIPTYAGVNEEGKSTWYYYEDIMADKLDENGKVMKDEDGNVIQESIGKERKITDDWSTANSSGKELQGDGLADLYGGFGTSLEWKGLDFSAQFTYQLGGLAYDSGYAFYMSSPSGTSDGSPYHRDLLNAWTPENSNSDIPRFAYNDTYSASTSTRFLIDASYLNIQNLTLGYTLPAKLTQKFLVNKLRVYVACDNVWYWSKRQGLDPRQSISGSTNPFYYAPIRTVSGGVTVTF